MEKCLIFITENEEKVKEVQEILGKNYKVFFLKTISFYMFTKYNFLIISD